MTPQDALLDLLSQWGVMKSNLRELGKVDPALARLMTDQVLRDVAELTAGEPLRVLEPRRPITHTTSAIDEMGRYRVLDLADGQKPDDVIRPGWRWATPEEISDEDARARARRKGHQP